MVLGPCDVTFTQHTHCDPMKYVHPLLGEDPAFHKEDAECPIASDHTYGAGEHCFCHGGKGCGEASHCCFCGVSEVLSGS